jgi:hypothetical protein
MSTIAPPDWKQEVIAWKSSVISLVDDITHWATRQNWAIAKHEKTITEDEIGTYTVPKLRLGTPNADLIIDPIARRVAGPVDGRVDIYAWPTYHRLILVRVGDQWSLKTDSGIDWPQPWTEKTFLELAQNLSSAP